MGPDARFPVLEKGRAMSIDRYLGLADQKLRLKEGDVSAEGHGGDVLRGRISVEDAQKMAAWRTYRPIRSFRDMGQYDAVLRSHCRLDREG
jgi:hypothetical protein